MAKITTNPHLELMEEKLAIKDDITILQLMVIAPGLVPFEKLIKFRAAVVNLIKPDPITVSNYLDYKLFFALECINEWMEELKRKI